MNDVASLKELAFGDVERELKVTRDVLAAIPADKFPWKPHPRSMSLMQLGIHVASLPEWLRDALDRDELDFSTAPRPPKEVADNAALLALFDHDAQELRQAIANFDMDRWNRIWTLRNGDQIFTAQPRPKVFRIWCMNHLIHHRGQLCLYLRLLEIKVPTVYFNTADDPTWVFD